MVTLSTYPITIIKPLLNAVYPTPPHHSSLASLSPFSPVYYLYAVKAQATLRSGRLRNARSTIQCTLSTDRAPQVVARVALVAGKRILVKNPPWMAQAALAMTLISPTWTWKPWSNSNGGRNRRGENRSRCMAEAARSHPPTHPSPSNRFPPSTPQPLPNHSQPLPTTPNPSHPLPPDPNPSHPGHALDCQRFRGWR